MAGSVTKMATVQLIVGASIESAATRCSVMLIIAADRPELGSNLQLGGTSIRAWLLHDSMTGGWQCEGGRREDWHRFQHLAFMVAQWQGSKADALQPLRHRFNTDGY